MQRHETDPLSLALGLVFVAISGAFLFGDVDAFEFVTVWALPTLLFATGVVLGALAIGRHRRGVRSQEDELSLD